MFYETTVRIKTMSQSFVSSFDDNRKNKTLDFIKDVSSSPVLDKALSVMVNTSLVLSISMGLFILMVAPGQPLDFLVSGTCLAR